MASLLQRAQVGVGEESAGHRSGRMGATSHKCAAHPNAAGIHPHRPMFMAPGPPSSLAKRSLEGELPRRGDRARRDWLFTDRRHARANDALAFRPLFRSGDAISKGLEADIY